jgi:hypothetical protein
LWTAETLGRRQTPTACGSFSDVTVMNTACIRRALVSGVAFVLSVTSLLPVAWAVEEGKLVQREGHWEYVSGEDPALKLLLEKHIITQDEYEQGARIIDMRERLSARPFDINYGQGLNINTQDNFLLKVRGAMQLAFMYDAYNQAWTTIGNPNTPRVEGSGLVPALRTEESAAAFSNRIARLQFLGYAFDPNLRFDLTIGADRPIGSSFSVGSVSVVNFYVTSWHLPYANLVVGQHKTWFNRAQIQSALNLTFTHRMFVQDAFVANAINRRDFGITLLSDESKYRLNYAIGVYNGMGITLDRLSQPFGKNANQLMYTARLLWRVAGNPLYGEGDILWSKTPQVAVAVAYAYNPGVDLVNPHPSTRNQLIEGSRNGRLLGSGIIDFQTWNLDFVARYRGWSLQAEGYYRKHRVLEAPTAAAVPLGDARGWYAMLGYYVVPRKLEVAVRYGIFDPSTAHSHDLVKESGVALNYTFDGSYDHRLIFDWTNLAIGSGGFAAWRQPVSTQDLVSNSFRLLYQFYW